MIKIIETLILGLLGFSAFRKSANGYAVSHKIPNSDFFFFFFFVCVCYMSEHQKIFTFSFELEHILYAKNSKIVKFKDVLFDNNTVKGDLARWD